MMLEWLRRHDAVLDEQLREYLFIDRPVLQKEEAQDAAEAGGRARGAATAVTGDGSLGIGSLREAVRR